MSEPVRWFHCVESDDGGVFRLGRCGARYVAEWRGLAELRADADGAAPALRWLTDQPEVREKLRRGAMTALLGHLRGERHWHAAAVRLRSGAGVLLLGDAGAGKSTLAAGLVEAGQAAFLADDVVRLDGDELRAIERRHALRADMARALHHDEGRAHKRSYVPRERARRAPLALVAVLGAGPTLSARALPVRARLAHATRHMVRWALDQPARMAADLERAMALSAAVPWIALDTPRPFAAWEQAADLLSRFGHDGL